MLKGIVTRRGGARYADSAHASREARAAADARIPTAGPPGKLRHLPWPERFDQTPRTEAVVWMLAVVTFSSLVVWGTARALARDEVGPEAYGVLTIAILSLIVLFPLHRNRIRRRIRWTRSARMSTMGPHEQGLLLPYARGMTVLSWLGVVGGLLGAGVMVLVIPFSSVGGYRQEVAGPLGVCAAAGVLWWAVTLLRTGWRKRGVLLNSDGVVFFGTRGQYSVRWDQIAEVSPARGLPDQPHEGIVVRIRRLAGASTSRGDGKNVPFEWLIRRDLLGIDPVLTNQVLNFYLENPAARAELHGPAAIQRLKKADVPAYVQPSVVNAEENRRRMETR